MFIRPKNILSKNSSSFCPKLSLMSNLFLENASDAAARLLVILSNNTSSGAPPANFPADTARCK
jgi:hypothetical protein